jgi:formate hydrogenlyase subunit 4
MNQHILYTIGIYIFPVVQSFLIAALSPLVIGLIRKMKAYLGNRVGASVLQPYRDLAKLFSKDEVISRDSSWVFRYVPYALFAITIILGTGLPVIAPLSFPWTGDFLVVIYLLGLSAFLIALAGMDTGGAFGGFGSSRELSMNAITEGVLLFALLPLVIVFRSTNLAEIAVGNYAVSVIAYLPIILAGMAYLVALAVENARIPVDNPTTHLELTMIHEAMILEYSGKRLALIEWASWNKLLFFIILGAHCYLPWGALTAVTLPAVVKAIIFLFANILLFTGLIALVESTMAKFRIFRVPDMIITGLVLGLIATLIIIL